MTISGWGIDQQTSETEFSVSTILYKAMVVGYTSSDCCGVGIFPIYLALKYASALKYQNHFQIGIQFGALQLNTSELL